MGRTKKVGITGKYGVRYGRTIRKRVLSVMEEKTAAHQCPSCLRPSVKREAPGIWFCKKCGMKFAGKAFKPAASIV